MEFEEQFETLLGLKPFPWQRRIYGKFLENEIPPVCDIPTGLGKTSVIPLWLLALAENKNLPRRLVYVVNRRTIVDQASDLVCSIRDTMGKALEDENSKLHKAACTLHAMDPLASNERAPFAVSTLRGEFADNQEWKSSPARPAIIVGTIDMIGSKVLFSGYGDTRRTRPLHAGLLGCDCLFVHDEAHLSPAFGKLLRSVQSFRCISREEPTRLPQMRVLELSATHIEGGGNEDESFVLDDDDKSHTIIKERLTAPKNLFLYSIEKDGKLLQEKTADLAQAFESSSCRVIVFLRSPEDAQKVAVGICEALQENAAQRVSVLTGRIRGRERDLLLEQPGMKPFLTEGTLDQTVFLIATSAAEVGMDLHADHMVCDLSTLDSMVQRLGRVNRFGTCKDTKVHVVYPEEICNKKNPSDLEKCRLKTLSLLRSLPSLDDNAYNASTANLINLNSNDRSVAFAPVPEMVELTPILLDLWAQTSAQEIAARPEPEAWLHGIQEEYPHTLIAWRNEVEYLEDLSEEEVGRWFNAHSILAPERLQLPTYVIQKAGGKDRKSSLLNNFQEEKYDATIIIISSHGDITKTTLEKLIQEPGAFHLNYATLVFASEIGGLTDSGFFDPKTKKPTEYIDTACDGLRRCILKRKGDTWNYTMLEEQEGAAPLDFSGKQLSVSIKKLEQNTCQRVLLKFQIQQADEFADEDDVSEKWLLLLGPRGVHENNAAVPPTVEKHNKDVEENAAKLCKAFSLPDNIRKAVILAARYHDKGKEAARWQVAIGRVSNDREPPLAKGPVDWRKLDGYRHEAGSILVVSQMTDIQQHPEKDLILHLIAAHHGWARPHFKTGAFPMEENSDVKHEAVYETMLRYNGLQRRFGWWGLAWLESILRRADAVASAKEQHEILEDES